MRIGITGGAGYIGSHVVRDLLEQDHELLILDNMSSGSPENVLSEHKRYRFLEGDIRDPAALDSFFDFKPEVVIHFAAFKAAGESMVAPELYADNNIRGSLFLLERMSRSDCRAIVFSSSAGVYGAPHYLPIDEDHPLAPENYYGFTKKSIEDNLKWFSKLKGIRFAALRYFNAAGYDRLGRVQGLEKNPNNLLPIVMEVAAGLRSHVDVFGTDYDTADGTCIRDYIHVNDLASAHILAMHHILDGADLVLNLGSQAGISVRQMVEQARLVTGQPIKHRDAPRRPGDPAQLVASSGRARQVLGWRTEFSDATTLIDTTWRAYQTSAATR